MRALHVDDLVQGIQEVAHSDLPNLINILLIVALHRARTGRRIALRGTTEMRQEAVRA
jgi:hypothetical protein